MSYSETSYPLPGNPNWVEVELKYSVDGKDYTFTAQAHPEDVVDRSEYQEIYSQGYINPVAYYNYKEVSISLNSIREWKIKFKETEMAETVVTTRKVIISDFTFESIAAARKKAGAPKSSTFETIDDFNDSGVRKEKSVTFTWNELLAV